MNVNKKIINMCNERGWSIYELSLQTGITQSSLSSMFQRGNPPKIENLQSICEAFGITLSQFFIEDEQMEPLTPKEKKLISLFRKLSNEKQTALISFMDR